MSLAVLVARLGTAWIAPVAAVTARERPSYVGIVILVVALLVGIPLAYRIYREVHGGDEPEGDLDQLSEFQQAYDEGEMDEEEFRRVRAVLIGAGGRGPGPGRPKVRPEPPRVVPDATAPEATDGDRSGGPVDEPEGHVPPVPAEPGPADRPD